MNDNLGFTKTQLQQLGEIIRPMIQQEVRPIIQQETRPIIEEALKPVKKDIREIHSILAVTRKDIHKIKSDLRTTINHFDRRILNHDIRLEKVETHLGFVKN